MQYRWDKGDARAGDVMLEKEQNHFAHMVIARNKAKGRGLTYVQEFALVNFYSGLLITEEWRDAESFAAYLTEHNYAPADRSKLPVVWVR